jgi:hypothetical protein
VEEDQVSLHITRRETGVALETGITKGILTLGTDPNLGTDTQEDHHPGIDTIGIGPTEVGTLPKALVGMDPNELIPSRFLVVLTSLSISSHWTQMVQKTRQAPGN